MENFNNKRNPVLPLNHHIPDCEAHVMPDGKLYIYGSYDISQTIYCSDQYYVVSTPDMQNWTIHDQSFSAAQAHWCYDPTAPKFPGTDWANPTPYLKKIMANMPPDFEKMLQEKKSEEAPQMLLFAPDAIEKDGKYYLYFCLSDQSEGVAVSDKPEGPFENAKQLMCGGIDPAIFVDDDGQAYYYWGQFFCHGAKLLPDMMTLDESSIVDNLITEEAHFFHEGSSMRKRGDIYYLVYANIANGKPTSLGYSTSKSPLGPFTYQGIIIDNDGCDPATWNNHGSIECFNNQWYVFYHRSSRGLEYNRRLCIEPITFNEDGTINEVKMSSQGVGAPFKAGEVLYGYQACALTGKIFIDVDGKNSEWLAHIDNGDSATFRYVQSQEGYSQAEIKAEGAGQVKILLNDVEVGSMEIGGTGSHYTAIRRTGVTDPQELKLVFDKVEALKIISIILK